MSKNYAFINCNLYNGQPQNTMQPGMTILVRNSQNNRFNLGIIEEVGPSKDVKIPADYLIIDLKDRYVIPGLINAHAHLFGNGTPSESTGSVKGQKRIKRFADSWIGRQVLYRMMKENMLTALYSGVTTVRCVGDMHFSDVRIRDKIRQGKYSGPDMLVSGPLICVSGGHGFAGIGVEADGPWEAVKRVRENVLEGVDLIKISVTGGIMDARKVGDAGRLQMTLEEVRAVCDEAHKMGMLVAAHVESREGIRIALQGGVDTIEHGSEMDEEIISLFKNNPRSLRGYSVLIATLYVVVPMHSLPAEVAKITPVSKQNATMVFESMQKGIRQALEAGVRIGLGTDASMPYITQYNTWRELDCLVQCLGISPREAIELATRTNAEILGLGNEIGTLEAGKRADFLVLRSDPLKNLRTLAEPEMVVYRGNVLVKPRPKKIKAVEKTLDEIRF